MHVIDLCDLAAFAEIAMTAGVEENFNKGSLEIHGNTGFLRNFAEIFSALGFIVKANENATRISVALA
ncbi:MAG: hypothetical protein J6K42_06135 [Clostridia bacterium]|nr:hypothetical protein [Clostridia bacterium]